MLGKDQTAREHRRQGSRWRLRWHRFWRSLLGWAFSTCALRSEPGPEKAPIPVREKLRTLHKVQEPKVSNQQRPNFSFSGVYPEPCSRTVVSPDCIGTF